MVNLSETEDTGARPIACPEPAFRLVSVKGLCSIKTVAVRKNPGSFFSTDPCSS